MGSEPKPSERDTSRSPDLSDSDSASSASNTNSQQIEWLATARQRRSTAGNRMKSMLANEEPDSDLELLFAEDENDQGFSDVGDDGSDVHMDSSSDDEDETKADDLEGEKELEKQAKERRAAQRKRKAQDAIPAKFRKKVRINPTRPAPPPRPKKKSERASWLPSPADLPTRASSRSTTRISKEQLHQQMVEREERRLKQLDQMAKKAARLEAMKKPPMTQEERLREAAIVEKRNSKSLNRWEVAEKQREEERRAKLAALNNRTLKGPVITFWSGRGDGRGTHMGQMVLEEKPKKKERKSKDKAKGGAGEKGEGQGVNGDGKSAPAGPVPNPKPDAGSESQSSQTISQRKPSEAPLAEAEAQGGASTISNKSDAAPEMASDASTTTEAPPPPKVDEPPRLMAMPPPPPPSQPPSGLAAPAPAPNSEPPASVMTPPSGLSRPPESKPSGVLAAPMLAPPPSININGGSSPPGYGQGNPKSNVLAPPDTTQRSAPPALAAPERPNSVIQATSASKPTTTSISAPPSTGLQPLKETHLQPISNAPAVLNKAPIAVPSESLSEPPAEPPGPETVTRNAIIFQHFDENAIKDRGVQAQILFNRKMSRLSKPSPMPLCVITNHPARYRDPKSGLPYCNSYAYREIQRLRRGEFRWSKLLGVWVGSGTHAARGVPERFLHPEKESPNKKKLEEQKANEKKKLAEGEMEDEQPKPVAEEPKAAVETIKLEETTLQTVDLQSERIKVPDNV
ncbi:Fc.00g006810.m01.CDS01 [Cosmosporella sp. VM-42]